MPTYDYKCKACGHTFEELQSFSEPVLTKCPKCKKNQLERLFGGGGAIIFKGSGFYETDYRRTGANGTAKPDTGDAAPKTDATPKSDAKPESTSGASSDSASSDSGAASTGKPGGKGGTKKAK